MRTLALPEITDLFLVATGKVRDKVSVPIGHHPPEIRCVESNLTLESLNYPQVNGIRIDGQEGLPALESSGRLKHEN